MTNAHGAGRSIPLSTFSTRDHAPRERLAAWRDLLGPSYAIDADPGDFRAETRLAQIDGMIIHAMDTDQQGVSRTARQIRRDGLEHFSFHLSHAGYGFRTGRGDGRLEAGEISVNDLARPFERSAAPERHSIVLSLPRDAVERVAPERALHGGVLRGGVARLLAAQMQMLAAHMGELPCAATRALMESTLAMLGAALSTGAPESRGLDAARLLVIKRHIRQNLARLSLSPETIARDLRISRTRLYGLFEAEGGVARYIAVRRLAAAAEALRDPHDFRPISALVVAFGFGSASAFSRAFRARYGLAPSEFRLARPGGAENFGRSAYAEWLRRLG